MNSQTSVTLNRMLPVYPHACIDAITTFPWLVDASLSSAFIFLQPTPLHGDARRGGPWTGPCVQQMFWLWWLWSPRGPLPKSGLPFLSVEGVTTPPLGASVSIIMFAVHYLNPPNSFKNCLIHSKQDTHEHWPFRAIQRDIKMLKF